MVLKSGSTSGANAQGLKALFHGFKDLQQLRIQHGNRLCANFYSRMGVSPGTSPEKLIGQNAGIIVKLKKDFAKITEGVVEAKKRTTLIKMMKKVGTELINNEIDLSLTRSYMEFLRLEKDTVKDIKSELQKFDLWNLYLSNVTGIGPSIAGGIISYLDIYKARYVSSFWKYCGLDAMPFTEEADKEYRFILEEAWPVKGGTRNADRYFVYMDSEKVEKIHNCEYTFRKGSKDVICASEEGFERFQEGDIICPINGKRDNAQRIVRKTDEPTPKGVFGEGRGRKKHHLVQREYVDKDGRVAKKDGLSFNPRAKTLFVGIMPDVLLKQNKHYNKIYWDKKNYYIADPNRKHPETGEHLLQDGHITMMARRYMAKIFLQNLWIAWKNIEKLPIERGPYHIEKLGLGEHPDPWFDPELWKTSGGKACFDPEKEIAA